MERSYASNFGNPGALHSFGQEALKAVDRARETVASLIGAPFHDVIFTSGATEANNLALRGVVKAFSCELLALSDSEKTRRNLTADSPKLKARVVISAIEHESVLETARDLERSGEAETVIIPVDHRGVVDVGALKRALNERAVLVSVMYVNNETGVIQPISEITRITKSYKLKTKSLIPLLHSDAAQALAYLDCGVEKLGVDLMTLSGHKVGGPKGVGALYVRRQTAKGKEQMVNNGERRISHSPFALSDLPLASLTTGGGQEFGLRAGTENVPAVVGFAEAMRVAVAGRARARERVARLRAAFLAALRAHKVSFEENVEGVEVSPHIVNLRFPGVPSNELLILLDRAGVAASAGSACTARALVPSHVLRAMGMSESSVRESIRVSFGWDSTVAEVREAAARLECVIGKVGGGGKMESGDKYE